MHHLTGHRNIVELKGTFEDMHHVHLVMELCAGGELFDRIIAKGHYSERAAAGVCREIVTVVHNCHSMGVMHRDLKPENFLFLSSDESSPLKATDFGLSVFFKPGIIVVAVVLFDRFAFNLALIAFSYVVPVASERWEVCRGID